MRRRFNAAAATSLALAALAAHASADAGDLDPGFGAGGTVLTDFQSGTDLAEALALLPDGRILVAGAADNGSDEDFALVRYLTTGGLDPTFGTAGKVTTPIGSEDDHANALVVQPDGKLLVAGTSRAAGIERFALVRYGPDGSLDATFGAGGIVVSAFPGAAGIAGIALQADGKIVAGGVHDHPNGFIPPAFALERYHANGALDATFGSGGRVETQIQNIGNAISSLLVQPDGKIVAAGIAATLFGSSFAVVRYQTNGSLDPAFGTGGIVQTSVGAGFAAALAIERQPDGKLLAGGGLDGSLGFNLVRYQSNGALDGTFGSGGIVTTPFIGSVDAIVVEPDGRIAAAGGTTDFGLARYLANGALDPSFGSGGLVTTPTGGPGKALARQTDGMLVVAGINADGASSDWQIARYQGLSQPIAFCQGTDANCPCGQGGFAASGCQNAQVTGGIELSASGYLPDGLGGGTVVLTGSNFPAMLAPAAVLIRSLGAETPPVVFGNGLRCIGLNGLLRVTARLANGGTTVMDLNHGAGPGNFHYQLWFRDQPISFCNPTTAFNFSNGLSIPW